MISKELRVQIQAKDREGWRPGTIAKALKLHPETVKRALEEPARQAKPRHPLRTSILDPWVDSIDEMLKGAPSLNATVIFHALKRRGYRGSVYPIRRYCKRTRAQPQKAYLDLQFLPGEMAQVDWADFGWLEVSGSRRRLYAFVMVLAHSRRIYARFFHDMTCARVLEGHVRAFGDFGGTPRQVLYDNMKTAVHERVGQAVRFNSSLLELCEHYAFEPRACNVRAGWEKGRVERAIRYLRESFFRGRVFEDLPDLNRQLELWLDEVAMERPWTDDPSKTVPGIS